MNTSIKFTRPIDGDVLFSVADGMVKDGALHTQIKLSAPSGKIIKVNGVLATECSGEYIANIKIDAYRTAIEAICEGTGETETMYIYWFQDGYMTYRLGIDDVILCFQNIYNNQDTYTSIFDDSFLAIYKELNKKYGTKVHMHIYYATDDRTFDLSMFPDKYKPEFIENSTWLKFTFHSLTDNPDSPYKHVSYEQVMREGRMVEEQIRRFAGAQVLANVTSQHWADSDIYGTRAFRALGYKVIDGYFIFDEDGEPHVSYYLNHEQTRHAHTRDFWVDNKEDIIFVKDDIVINEIKLEDLDAYMDDLKAGEDHCFMYLLIHEQYFYKNYSHYQSDYKEKIFRTVEWCIKNGYRTTFISDIAFEKQLAK